MIIVGFCGQIAALLQLAWPASLLLAGSGAAARKGRSRVRHFAMLFASTVVNAANADHAPRCVCVAPHGCVLCTWLCGIHCVPRRGATALLGTQHGTGAHDSGSSSGCSGVGAAVAMACGRLSFLARTAVAVLSLMGLACGICRALLHWSIGSGHGGASQKGGY